MIIIALTFDVIIHINYKPVGDMARAYTGDADAVLDHGLLIAM